MTKRTPGWVFDQLPPSGARRGGDPSEHAFDATLATFVREVIQNANDQAIDQQARRSAVYFDHYELSGDELKVFLSALDEKNLLAHVEAAAESIALSKLRSGLEASSKRLSLLRVADYHTHGLTGEEDAEQSHFRSLCKDTLLSYKQGDGAGGSYGLGKSVLWSFSSLSTVLFSSSFDEGSRKRFRLIGRAELPSHKVRESGYSGSGWFGLSAKTETGDRAESVWDEQARELASSLYLNRGEGSGTSILVVGFRDPTTDDELTQERLLSEIRSATGRDFWPALTWPGAPLEVFVDGQRVDVELDPELAPIVQCWRATDGSKPPTAGGEIIQHEIHVDLPRRRDAKKKGGRRVRARLALHLGDPNAASDTKRSPRETSVFRGPGMIVDRWPHNDLQRSPRPFRAILACGLARSPENPSQDDHELEHFLRCCEPPGHDVWRATPRVKTEYVRGYGKALQQLRSEVETFIRKHVLQSEVSASEAPAHIRELFPLFAQGPSSGTPSAFVIYDLKATLKGNTWDFDGAIRSASPGRPWRGEVRLFPVDEDGTPVGEPIPIDSLIFGNDGSSAAIEDGAAKIVADESVRELRFSGQSAALADHSEAHVAVCLEVNAQVIRQ